MKKVLLCFCAVALTTTAGCDLFGDPENDASTGDDVLCADIDDLTDVNESICDVTVDQNACHGDTACSDGMHCFAPGEPNCGICMPIELTCAADTDCALLPTTVCDIPYGGCPQCNPGLDCIPACNIVDGTTCDEEHPDCLGGHCVAHGCIMESDCPPNFMCEGDVGIRKCIRKTCMFDEGCGDCGWCVGNQCYDEPGHCDYMAP